MCALHGGAAAHDHQGLPFYQPHDREIDLFEHAWRNHLPVLIKGPTGVGKTRFVSYMAARLGLPLFTVACHDDLTAADLVGRACLRERISKRCRQPLILHADNGNAMRAATLESRLEELGVLRSFSRPRVSNDNPFSESLFRTVKYRPDYPRRPFQSVEEACGWVADFVDWYNHRHRHSGIRFVTPVQRHTGEAQAICRHRARVYEQAREQHPRRWSRSTRCWRQPEVVWINPPPIENVSRSSTLARAA